MRPLRLTLLHPPRLEGVHEAMRAGSVLFHTATSIQGLANCNAASLRSIGPECRTARNRVAQSVEGKHEYCDPWRTICATLPILSEAMGGDNPKSAAKMAA